MTLPDWKIEAIYYAELLIADLGRASISAKQILATENRKDDHRDAVNVIMAILQSGREYWLHLNKMLRRDKTYFYWWRTHIWERKEIPKDTEADANALITAIDTMSDYLLFLKDGLQDRADGTALVWDNDSMHTQNDHTTVNNFVSIIVFANINPAESNLSAATKAGHSESMRRPDSPKHLNDRVTQEPKTPPDASGSSDNICAQTNQPLVSPVTTPAQEATKTKKKRTRKKADRKTKHGNTVKYLEGLVKLRTNIELKKDEKVSTQVELAHLLAKKQEGLESASTMVNTLRRLKIVFKSTATNFGMQAICLQYEDH